MKKIIFSICAISLLSTAYAQTLDRSIRPKAGPAPVIHLADAESFTLDNGLKVFVVENHKMPLVTYSIQLDIRQKLEGDKAGMSDFVGELITSGTKDRSKDEFDEQSDEIGASIGASSEGIYGQSLTKHQDKLLSLMSDALLNANFQQTELDKLKKQTISGLTTSANEPDAMLSNVSGVLNFGKDHPFGEVITPATVGNITLADCNNYYKTYFRPNVAYLAVVGDVTLAQAKELVTKYFGKWEKADVPRTNYPEVKQPTKTTVDFVSRDGAVQSVIGITYPVALKPGTPDVIKVNAMNEILGGSGEGRLFLNLRESKAWTYGAYSSVSSSDIMGTANVYAKARNVVTDSSVNEMLKEMHRIRDEKVTQTELQNMLNFMSGKFALALESPQTIARFAINIEKYNMPKDYYKNYLKNVNAVTVDDIQAMAQKYILPDHAHIIVVGNNTEANKLKRFASDGEIHYYDNYGNSVKPVETKEVNGVKVEDVLNNYIKAIGGKTAIEGLKDMSVSATAEQGGQELNVSIKTISPDKFKQTIYVGGNEAMQMVVNKDKGFVMQMGTRHELPAEALTEYQEQADLQADLHPEKYGISYSLLGIESVDGKDAYNVQKVSNNGKDRTVQYYDVATGLLVKEISNTTKNGQPVVSIKVLSNYKEVKNGNGYKMPFDIQTTGSEASKITISSAKANSGIKESDFK